MESQARRKLSVADHILTQTYPLVKDPKLLVAVVQNLVQALDAAVEDALRSDVAHKRLVTMPGDPEARLSALRSTADEHGVAPDFFRFAEELRETLREHEHSPVEFVRKEKLVICDESYKVRTLAAQSLATQLREARRHVETLEKVKP